MTTEEENQELREANKSLANRPIEVAVQEKIVEPNDYYTLKADVDRLQAISDFY